ncbi:MAG: hypothetical protein E7241_07750 [Lachnospiraceae bacterium]|jgi:hypothetical protein|nr:hypothetical protein [Lachnospiraceae bacterium]
MNKVKCKALAVIAIFSIMGCNSIDNKGAIDIGNASICVSETRGYQETSALVFYDMDLNEVGKKSYKYASFGEAFYTPEVYDNELYIVPQGIANRKDEKKVLRINLSSLCENIYNINQYAINSICVNEKYLYTCNTLNGNSCITRCDKKNNKVKEYIIEEMYVSKLVCTQENIFAFGLVSEGITNNVYLYVFDSNLNLVNRVDITACGSDHYKAVIRDGKLYFSNSYDYKGMPNNTVTIYSIAENSLETIQLDENFPNDILFNNDVLLVSHYDIVAKTGGGITLFNLDTKEKKYIKLDHGAMQMTAKGDYVFFLADYKIYKYKLEPFDLKFEKMIEVSPLGEEFYYCSGLFSFGK